MDDELDYMKMSFAKGYVLFKEGGMDDEVFLIVRGAVEIRKSEGGKDYRRLGIAGRGEVVGEMALIDDQPHMATAVVLEDVEVTVMSRDAFLKRLNAMDPAMRGLVLLIVKRARQLAAGMTKGWQNGDRSQK